MKKFGLLIFIILSLFINVSIHSQTTLEKTDKSWNETSPSAVELSSFTASVNGSTVKLKWKTESEANNTGFEIERAVYAKDRLSNDWETMGFVNGSGTSKSPKYYSFEDRNSRSGKYLYRLKQINNDGQFEYSKTIEVDLGAPRAFDLGQNYPNPFNPTTTITYKLPQASSVKLIIYNLLGQEIEVLVDGYKEAGVHSVEFDASELKSGLYIYKIQASGYIQTRKMTLIK
jgi:hypothetical protein